MNHSNSTQGDQPPAHNAQASQCVLCARQSPLTFHHLIPRKLHRRTFFKKHYTREQLHQGIMICRRCHSGLHKLYDEMTLAKQFNTLEALRNDPALQKHCAWVAKQKIRAL